MIAEDVGKYTIPEVISHWFEQSNDPHAVFEQVGREAFRLYFVNNRVVELALAEIRRLEFTHKCEVTEEIRLLILAMPMDKETIHQLVEEVRKHVEND